MIDVSILAALTEEHLVFWTGHDRGCHEYYAVSDTRVAVIDASKSEVRHALTYQQIDSINVDEASDGSGTLSLHTADSSAATLFSGHFSPSQPAFITLRDVANVRDVHALIRKHHNAACGPRFSVRTAR